MKPKHSGNVPPSPSERLEGGGKGKMPKIGPGGIQPAMPATQQKRGLKCFDDQKDKNSCAGKHTCG